MGGAGASDPVGRAMSIITKSCAHCGTSFDLPYGNRSWARKYCGKTCLRKATSERASIKRRGVLVERQCKHCDALFMPSNVSQIYCSDPCGWRFRESLRTQLRRQRVRFCVACKGNIEPERNGNTTKCRPCSKTKRKNRWCQTCGAELVGKQRKRCTDCRRAAVRDFQRAAVYGLSIDEYQAIIARTRCDSCGDTIDTNKRDGSGVIGHIDHDHITGNVRGYLCRYCNHALGNAKDSVERLRMLIAYLERSMSA